ncbi:UDP-glucose dehydrogenase family protein [Paenibacillus piri]|uniref:UDP-glucose 6-dehydrogenase n=1 Tax=Paenibacillus piri TaxID=2547395 RepID=A0A4R5KR14_9BACL|nr:UDP-glucose/GDP-mannose dehydrogenase family protein [Paenibacillus piri]TDF98026.1 UDP-glucose/GDP-mannose dehydrogenase family protein [Paenibacillus piri]
MRIAVIGTGYVGLVTGACLARLGHSVICSDRSAEKISVLASGGLPIWEQGLDELLSEASSLNRIRFTTNIKSAVQESDILIICVGTPFGPNGEADLTQLWSVVKQIARHSTEKKFLVVKSTVPVGTTDEIDQWLQSVSANRNIDVIHNPEFLRQGNAIRDFFHPDRIVAGCRTDKAKHVVSDLYKDLPSPILFCDSRSSELIKYASNAFLAMKISYINMIADFSEQTGARIDVVAEGIGMDSRIGEAFLRAGIGYGGSCFPKDIMAFRAMGQKWDCPMPLLDSTVSINRLRPRRLVNKLTDELGMLKGKRIALLGLAFKPMTDDLREAPSLQISRICLEQGAAVHAYDPHVSDYPVPEVVLHRSLYDAIDSSDAVVIVTELEQLRCLDWQIVSKKLRTRLIIDGRNMFAWEEMLHIADTFDMTYISVGRPPIPASAAAGADFYKANQIRSI